VKEILLFNKFFSDCRHVPYLQRYSPTNFAMVRMWRIFGDFLHPVFSASRVQHISDMHSNLRRLRLGEENKKVEDR